jgi:hypothetical protein
MWSVLYIRKHLRDTPDGGISAIASMGIGLHMAGMCWKQQATSDVPFDMGRSSAVQLLYFVSINKCAVLPQLLQN